MFLPANQFGFDAPPLAPFLGLLDRATHGRNQLLRPVLEHIVGRPGLETLDGRVFSDCPGNEQKRCFGAFRSRGPQGCQAVVRRQQIICQDDVELLGRQSPFKGGAAFCQDQLDREPFLR